MIPDFRDFSKTYPDFRLTEGLWGVKKYSRISLFIVIKETYYKFSNPNRGCERVNCHEKINEEDKHGRLIMFMDP